jgi:FAD/FMN-containing dehydrogenase
MNATYSAVSVAAGHTGAEVLAELAAYNTVTATGFNPSVGIIGWLTGGGHGPLTTSYGMGADNLLEATVVTPLGDILVASPCENPDLFFAIRGGGGGTYGVVLQAILKTYPSPITTSYELLLASASPNATTRFWELMGFIHSKMQRLKDGGVQGNYVIVGPPSASTLSFVGKFYLYNKPNGTFERLMAPIKEKLEEQTDFFTYLTNTTTTDTYWESYVNNVKNEDVANRGSAYGSWLMSSESLADMNVTAKMLEQVGPSNDAKKPNVSSFDLFLY